MMRKEIIEALSAFIPATEIEQSEMWSVPVVSNANCAMESQPSLHFKYAGIDYDILLRDQIVMCDEKTFSYAYQSASDVVEIVTKIF